MGRLFVFGPVILSDKRYIGFCLSIVTVIIIIIIII